jgi:CubicO group peptidase (beta-lactamase class C family)
MAARPCRARLVRAATGGRVPVTRALCFALLPMFLFSSPGLAARPTSDHARKLDSLVTSAHESGGFDGAVLVAENGRVVFKKAYGLADREWNVPNATDTRFRIGSVTKVFTAILVMQFVQEGKLDLDAHISDYLPDYPAKTARVVTLRHLLSHTSGIPSYTQHNRYISDPDSCGYWVRYSPEELVATFSNLDLRFEPGSRFEYCNSAYVLLGVILEKVSGKPYEHLLRERILVPLGMKDTGYTRPETVIPRRARGYLVTNDGYANGLYDNTTISYSAGALYSTVDDLFKLDQALYSDALLDAKTRELMFTHVVTTPRGGYALGWNEGSLPLPGDRKPARFVGHVGDASGFFALIFRFTGTKDVIIMLTNSDALNPQTGQALLGGVAAIMYGPGR